MSRATAISDDIGHTLAAELGPGVEGVQAGPNERTPFPWYRFVMGSVTLGSGESWQAAEFYARKELERRASK